MFMIYSVPADPVPQVHPQLRSRTPLLAFYARLLLSSLDAADLPLLTFLPQLVALF